MLGASELLSQIIRPEHWSPSNCFKNTCLIKSVAFTTICKTSNFLSKFKLQYIATRISILTLLFCITEKYKLWVLRKSTEDVQCKSTDFPIEMNETVTSHVLKGDGLIHLYGFPLIVCSLEWDSACTIKIATWSDTHKPTHYLVTW